MSRKFDILSSLTNPNGLLDEFSSGIVETAIKDPRQRVILAIADTKSFLVEVAGLDLDMADVAAARSAREMLGALGIQLSDEGTNVLLQEASAFSNEAAVDRAIHMTLGTE